MLILHSFLAGERVSAAAPLPSLPWRRAAVPGLHRHAEVQGYAPLMLLPVVVLPSVLHAGVSCAHFRRFLFALHYMAQGTQRFQASCNPQCSNAIQQSGGAARTHGCMSSIRDFSTLLHDAR